MNDVAQKFQNYLEAHQDAFKAWGDFVVSIILKRLSEQEPNLSLKIEPKPRVKEISSAIAKIGRKNYQDPVREMTDLVGVRFVVLLAEDIAKICQVIESIDWNCRISRDFTQEIEKNPTAFDYQSKHYEIRPKQTFALENHEILDTFCCEVQVRSLLQHAYAELVHDNVYKTDGVVPNQAKREVAKSMALMEATDDIFSKTLQILNQANSSNKSLLNDLQTLFQELIEKEPNTDIRTNMIVLEDFSDSLPKKEEIAEFFKDNQYLILNIKDKQDNFFFQQPIILMLYWLVKNKGANFVYDKFPLPAYLRELDWICSDLGTQRRQNPSR